MSGLTRRFYLAAALETAYGDGTAPGTSAAMLVKDLDIQGFEATAQDLARAYADTGKDADLVTQVLQRVRFSIDLHASGTAGTAPAFAPLLRACGLAQAIQAGTSVTYTPVASGYESLSIACNKDSTRHRIAGARGTVTIEAQAGQAPKLNFEFIGRHQDPDVLAMPIGDYAAWRRPLAVNNANTSFSLGGVALVLQQMQLQLGNSLVYLDRPGLDSADVQDRASTGAVTVHAPALGTFNAFTKAKSFRDALAPAGDALAFTHQASLAAGNRIAVTCAGVQIMAPAYGDDQGRQTLAMNLKVLRQASAPLTEFAIAFT